MSFDLDRGVAVLARTPAVLRDLLAGLPDAWTHADEGPETWSPFDVVGHLVDGEETDWMVRARIVLGPGPERRFEPFDRFRHLRLNRGRTLDELLDRFAELRARNLEELAAMELGPEELRRTGEHPELGPVTLEQLLATWVAHDLNHLAQIARVMAKQLRGEVGPWAQYLSILHR
ncbi:MAG TPA: DinB family protein [Thermoanaerobaculia bacterium]|nr:DinB family protein [Thermoanaerobaculia bacterium]